MYNIWLLCCCVYMDSLASIHITYEYIHTISYIHITRAYAFPNIYYTTLCYTYTNLYTYIYSGVCS